MNAARSYVMPKHLAVFGDVAPSIHALLIDGRRNVARRGQTLPGGVLVWLAQLDEMVGSTVDLPVEERWLSTAEAAEIIGLSPRTVSAMPIPGRRKIQGNWRYPESEVYLEAEAQAESRKLRQAPEGSGAAA